MLAKIDVDLNRRNRYFPTCSIFESRDGPDHGWNGRLTNRLSIANGLGKDAWAIYRPIALGPDVRSYFPPGDLRLPRAFLFFWGKPRTARVPGPLGTVPGCSGERDLDQPGELEYSPEIAAAVLLHCPTPIGA